MKKGLVAVLTLFLALGFIFTTSVVGADLELAKKSTIEKIIKRVEMLVVF